MSAVRMVPSGLVEYAPMPKTLPPGWVMVGWDISLDNGSLYRAVRVWGAFVHMYEPGAARSGAKADVEFEFPEGRPPNGYEWLCRFLIVAQDIPDGVRADVDGSRW